MGKVGWFDGKIIIAFLRTYTCEMEIYEVPKVRTIHTFDLGAMPKTHERVKELDGEMYVNTRARFVEKL